MQRLIFIENSSDIAQLSPETLSGARVVNLNPVENVTGESMRQISDYISDAELMHLNRDCVLMLRNWLSAPALNSYFKKEGRDATFFFDHSLGRAVYTLCRYIDIIDRILKSDKPDEVIFFEDCFQPSDLKFNPKDRIAGLVVPALTAAFSKKIRLCPLKIKENGFLLPEIKHSGKIKGFLIKSNSIICTGAPRIMEPLAQIIEKERTGVVWMQSRFAPRIFLNSAFRGRGYAVSTRPSSHACFSDTAVAEFVSVLEKNDLFKYKNIFLGTMLASRWKYLFEKLLPSLSSWAESLSSWLKTKRVKMLLIDEDMSDFARVLIFAAKEAGVPSVEYQHGAITTYYLQRDFVDYKFVWGNFFSDTLNRECGFPPSRIKNTGPVHFGSLKSRHGKKNEDARKIKKDFKIADSDSIVIYTPHSFHKSGKGGLAGVHQSRNEAEEMLADIIDGLKDTDSHLIVKLHHADFFNDFYLNTIQMTAPSLRYSLIKQYDIHRLLNSADLIVTPVSTVVLESLLLNKQLLLIDYGRKRNFFPYSDWKAVTAAHNREETPRLIKDLLKNRSGLNLSQEGRGRILREFVKWENEDLAALFSASLNKIVKLN